MAITHGCPVSGSVRDILFDPFARVLCLRILPSMGVAAAFADDAVVAMRGHLILLLHSLSLVFALAKLAAGLDIRIGKTIVVPLWAYVEQEAKAALAKIHPDLSQARTNDAAKYLGVWRGPIAMEHALPAATDKHHTRCAMVKSMALA